jgi:hypothetical protein
MAIPAVNRSEPPVLSDSPSTAPDESASTNA